MWTLALRWIVKRSTDRRGGLPAWGGQPLRYIKRLYIDAEGEESNCGRGRMRGGMGRFITNLLCTSHRPKDDPTVHPSYSDSERRLIDL